MIKKIIKEIERLEQLKLKKQSNIEVLQSEVNKIDEELKKYKNLKKQYDKLEESANHLVNGD